MEQPINQQFQQFSEPIKKSRKIWWVVGIIMVGILIAGGYLWQRDFVNEKIGDLFEKDNIEQNSDLDNQQIPQPSILVSEESKNYWQDLSYSFIDLNGNIYITTKYDDIIKFDQNGNFVKKFGGFGSEPGKFNSIGNIVFDENNNILVSDRGDNQNNFRIQKFDPSGNLLKIIDKKFFSGIELTDSIMNFDIGINNIWILLKSKNESYALINYSLTDGKLLNKINLLYDYTRSGENSEWIKEQFKSHIAIQRMYVDWRSDIYVLIDMNNDKKAIQKFSSEGNFLFQYDVDWMTVDFCVPGAGLYEDKIYYLNMDGGLFAYNQTSKQQDFIHNFKLYNNKNSQLFMSYGLNIDKSGNFYILSNFKNSSGDFTTRLQKYNYKFNLLQEYGLLEALPEGPLNVSADKNNNIYAIFNSGNFENPKYLFKKFDNSGNYISQINLNQEASKNCYVWDFVLDSKDNFYLNCSGFIKKFDFSGNLIKEWEAGGVCDESGQSYIAIDSYDNVYFTENVCRPGGDYFPEQKEMKLPKRIKKFNSEGEFIKAWDLNIDPEKISIDAQNNIYVLGNGLQKFDSNGNFISEFKNDEFLQDNLGFVVDSKGFIYAIYGYDFKNSRLSKFSSNGEFLSNLGEYGNKDNQFIKLVDITIDSLDNIYIADIGNHRIQKFSPVK